jgi:ribonucleoside-diphosphate reductase alpha chain
VIRALVRSRPGGGTFHIEDVQDHVELGLMRGGHHEWPAPTCCTANAARRSAPQAVQEAPKAPVLHVIDGGQRVPLDINDAAP